MNLVCHKEVRLFIEKLQKPTRSKVVRSTELLTKYGQNLGMPHVKKVATTLYELRVRGQQEVRIFFVRYNQRVILLHGFVKKTPQTPQREIVTAQKRLRILTFI